MIDVIVETVYESLINLSIMIIVAQNVISHEAKITKSEFRNFLEAVR